MVGDKNESNQIGTFAPVGTLSGLISLWQRYGRFAVLLADGVLLAAVFVRLVPAVDHVWFGSGGSDLRWYRELIQDWFAGVPVYHRSGVSHPPALFLLLWPIYGWLSVEGTRWLYVVTTALSMAGLIALLLREARLGSRVEAAFFALLVLACYPTANTIATGQATFYVLLALLGAMVLLMRAQPSSRRDFAAGALLLFALAKPNISLAFFPVALFAFGALRPFVIAMVGYLVTTVLAAMLHGSGPVEVVMAWLGNLETDPSSLGYGNLHVWLASLGLTSWMLPATAVTLLLHGIWTWRHRAADPWILLGVAAIVARVSIYHRLYDDLLLILPLIALYRIARGTPAPGVSSVAFGLLILGSACLARAAFIEGGEPVLVSIWLLEAAFLTWQAGRSYGTEKERATD